MRMFQLVKPGPSEKHPPPPPTPSVFIEHHMPRMLPSCRMAAVQPAMMAQLTRARRSLRAM
eukprot:3167614-Alexandrium_andersonii.AAC.1